MEEKKKILITGGCGFIGAHFIEHILRNTDWEIVVIDRLNYASSGFDRLRDIDAFDDKRVLILAADFTKPIEQGLAKEIGELDYIAHMGAETHVDNSIKEPEPFIMSNVVGTMRMLDFARKQKNLKWFVQFSTDEVYGPASEGYSYKETDRLNSTNPYSASKAGAEQLAMAYANCYNLPVMVTNTMNVFGERQHPEKFIPMTIKNIRDGNKVIIHGNKDKTKAGSRFWIHARNVAGALLFLLDKMEFKAEDKYYNDGTMGQYNYRYNIVGEKECDNLQLAKLIAEAVGKPLDYEMVDFHSQRPGHDLRYSLDGTKMTKNGWILPINFEESLKNTVKWTLSRKEWL